MHKKKKNKTDYIITIYDYIILFNFNHAQDCFNHYSLSKVITP